ncbi:helix-turn-helix transcriptional regulator [Chryseobacterium sp.]|uniref:helix-turn-helix domain-containing protein n=1 Tax=Chryseobacterium sp. TaxID=1871047 RepID=UPI0028968916|nr:helix-turn-helix transcriptional regulator [Chryseobacterium sp.]
MDGQTLKDARKVLGLSQEEMAAKIYVSFPTYNGYENGKNIPKNKHAVINAVLIEASLKEEEQISDEVLKKDAKDLLVDVLTELKAVRKENRELKKLFSDYIDAKEDQSKINELQSAQINLLKKVSQNHSKQIEEIKRADIKSASTK